MGSIILFGFRAARNFPVPESQKKKKKRNHHNLRRYRVRRPSPQTTIAVHFFIHVFVLLPSTCFTTFTIDDFESLKKKRKKNDNLNHLGRVKSMGQKILRTFDVLYKRSSGTFQRVFTVCPHVVAAHHMLCHNITINTIG